MIPVMRSSAGKLAAAYTGLGLLALALFATHGIELTQWPARVRQALAV